MPHTIQDVIDSMIASVSGVPWDGSVDTVKCGDPTRTVTGVVTTFTASVEVLRQAAKLGANLIITHEPTFYEHRDETGWLEDDLVYQAKRDVIRQHELVIWRFHDYWHWHQPDGIITGVLKVLEWQDYAQQDPPYTLTLPPMTLANVATHLKQKLALPSVRMVGNPEMQCRRIVPLVGAYGGVMQIQALRRDEIDAVICGETVEWQVCEYVRDANALGQPKGLIILGHARSEEAGMQYLADWLRPKIADIPVTYVPVGDPVQTY